VLAWFWGHCVGCARCHDAPHTRFAAQMWWSLFQTCWAVSLCYDLPTLQAVLDERHSGRRLRCCKPDSCITLPVAVGPRGGMLRGGVAAWRGQQLGRIG
jgi:hypothetical protein